MICWRLRRSDNAEIGSRVFLNLDLTPSEAQAACERRQRRRQRQAQRAMAAIADFAACRDAEATSPQHQRACSASERKDSVKCVNSANDSDPTVVFC